MKRAVPFLSIAIALALALSSSSPATADPKPTPKELEQARADLAAQRELNLQRFRDYRLARVYPHNSYQVGVLNVWTDADGHLCAVATLMEKAGLHATVARVGVEQNFVRIAELTSGPVLDWALTSGLTQEELVMIQQPSAADIEAMEAERLAEQRKLRRLQRREDDRLEGAYLDVERTLRRRIVADAGLDVAVARLAARPDLIRALRARTAEAAAKKKPAPKRA